MPDYQAVLFDFDGVLADSEPVHFECWREILDEFGIPLEWPRYVREFIGVSDRDMITRLAAERGVDPARVLAEHPRKKERFRTRMSDASAVTAEVRALLAELSSWKLAVVTSSGRSEIEPILRATGILDSFATAVYGGDVTDLKPSPAPYLLAAERLGVARALVVEDSDAGVASGQAAGFDVLRIPSQADMPRLVRGALGLT